jgi:hypothetical protein|tara:strand:+ start:264 stop:767 length:504 start_codon:yes stop_codon:yes gene_type:complete
MWTTDLVLMLRTLIGDLDSAKYADTRLQQVLVIGAYNVNNDAPFNNNYVIDVNALTIAPDPITKDDSDFNVLTIYKSACILLGSEVKTESSNSISIKDGPSAIDLRGVSASLHVMYKDFCEKYDELLRKYNYEKGSGDGTPAGVAVLGPYSPASWGVGYNDRRGGHF